MLALGFELHLATGEAGSVLAMAALGKTRSSKRVARAAVGGASSLSRDIARRSGEDTRLKLIRAAEQLFAERGIAAVSLREINRSAGQRNATALQYHFGTRRQLMAAVLDRHRVDVGARRHALLDQYEAGPRDLRMLTTALVVPEAGKLSDPDGGCAYLRIMAQLLQRAELSLDPADPEAPQDSIHRWRRLVAEWMPELAVRRLHRRFTAIRILFVELGRRAENPRSRNHKLFVSHLIDLIQAILIAPLSSETEELARQPKAVIKEERVARHEPKSSKRPTRARVAGSARGASE